MTTLHFTATYTHGLRGLISALSARPSESVLRTCGRRAGANELSHLPLRTAKFCVVALCDACRQHHLSRSVCSVE